MNTLIILLNLYLILKGTITLIIINGNKNSTYSINPCVSLFDISIASFENSNAFVI